MAKLPDIDLDAAPETRAAFAKVAASRGWVSNLMRAMAHAPEALQHYSALGHYGRYGSDLTEVQRELVIVITVRGVEYGWTHHSNLARQIGITGAQLSEIKAGRTPATMGAAERALSDYVFAFSACAGVPDALLKATLAHFSPRQVTDIGLLSAYYIAAGALIIGLSVEVEPKADLQAELAWQKTTIAARK
ncbi:MAG: carboxymuconolactone decarboxylase family protein [Nevskiales bacterium]